MPVHLTLPKKPPKRTRTLNIRLSEQERAAIIRLAKQHNLPTSYLARHLLLQAVAYHTPQAEAARD